MMNLNIIENFSLKNHNTFKIDAKTRFFTEPKNEKEIIQAIEFSKEKNIPFLLLGGGSNLLLTQDFDGICIYLNHKGIQKIHETENEVFISVQGGEILHEFILWCIEKNYGGIENLSLIPGRVGSSPVQNVGAYGCEIKDLLHECKVLNTKTLKTETLSNSECQFGYRNSIFKRNKNLYIITEVTFKLTKKNHKINIAYGNISQELEKNNIQNPTIKQISDTIIKIRQEKLPDTSTFGNAGSFFKNPTISPENFKILQKKYKDIPNFINSEGIKIPAAWLIEQSGWKGKKINNVATHQAQPLVIINATGNATGKEIFDFSTEIINAVHHQFNIKLEREVNII